MANPFDQFDETKPPDVTVTKIGDREIAQPGQNPFDSFDEPQAAQTQSEQEKVGVGEYLWNQIKLGVTDMATLLDVARKRFGKIMSEGELAQTLAPFAMQGADVTGRAPTEVTEQLQRAAGRKDTFEDLMRDYQQSQRMFAGITGAEPEMVAPGVASQIVGAGLRTAADPFSYLGAAPLKAATLAAPKIAAAKLAGRAAGETLTGAAAETAGMVGEEAERAITGEPGVVGRLAGSLAGAYGSAIPRQVVTGAAEDVARQVLKNREMLQKSPGGAQAAYATGAAKRLLTSAAEAQGAESAQQLIADVNEAARYVDKSNAPLVISMADNPVIRQQVERLAITRPEFRKQVDDLIRAAREKIEAKTTTLFGERYGAEVPKGAGLKIENIERRRADLDRRLEQTAETFVPGVDKETLGQRIEKLVEDKKDLARQEVKPKYNELLAEARTKNIVLPEQGVQELYDFVRQNKMRDVFIKGTPLDKKVMEALSPDEDGVFTSLSFDNVDSLKRAINELKRKRLSDDQMRRVLALEDKFDEVRKYLPEDYSARLQAIDTDYYNKVGIPFSEQGIREIDAKRYAEQVAPVIVKTPESYRQFIRAVGPEKGNELAENAIISEVYEKTVKNGIVSPTALAKYVKDKAAIIDGIPGLREKLQGALVDDTQIRAQINSLNEASKAAQLRVANNALTQFEFPDYNAMARSVIDSPKMRQKIFRDIGDLDAQTAKAVRNSLRAEVINIAQRSPGGFMSYISDPANKSGVEAVFGTAFMPSLRKIATFADKVSEADVSKLAISIPRESFDMLARVVKGVDIPYVTSQFRDRISSYPQKIVRILSKYNSASLRDATDDAIVELLLDPNGVQKLANTITEVKFDIENPASLAKITDSLNKIVPRATYNALKVGVAGEQQEQLQQEAQQQQAEEFVPGGFEEEPAPFKKGGAVKRRPAYTPAEKDLLRRYSSR